MEGEPTPLIRLGQWALRWHWPLLVVMGILAAAVEVAEHSRTDGAVLSLDLIQEVFLVGIFVPVIAGLLLDELARAKKRAAIDQVNAVDAERYRLSRDVHDGLAQELTYLHLRLDQLSMDIFELDREAVQSQLGQMREVAAQAYRRVYDTLALLRIPESAELTEILMQHAGRIGKRARLDVSFSRAGEACPLPHGMRQELLYIYAEMLSNVEKHTGAQHLAIGVAWGSGELTISVSDDGRGFDPETALPGHYGLVVMRERAHDLGGKLSVMSQPGRGTEARLSVRFEPCVVALDRPVFDSWPAAETEWQEVAQ
jgi:signal transduction histidine kinase